nr:hypothetical protein [Rhodococcus trifolii]
MTGRRWGIVEPDSFHRAGDLDPIAERVADVDREHVSLVMTDRPVLGSVLQHLQVVEEAPEVGLVKFESDVVNAVLPGQNGDLVVKLVDSKKLYEEPVATGETHEGAASKAHDGEEFSHVLDVGRSKLKVTGANIDGSRSILT